MSLFINSKFTKSFLFSLIWKHFNFPIPDSYDPQSGGLATLRYCACKEKGKIELWLSVRSLACWFNRHNSAELWLIFKLHVAMNVGTAFSDKCVPYRNTYLKKQMGLAFPFFSLWVKMYFSPPWSSFLFTHFFINCPYNFNSLEFANYLFH